MSLIGWKEETINLNIPKNMQNKTLNVLGVL